MRRTQRGSFLAKNGFEDPHERIGQLILEIVLRVYWDVVLENIDRILRLLVRCST